MSKWGSDTRRDGEPPLSGLNLETSSEPRKCFLSFFFFFSSFLVFVFGQRMRRIRREELLTWKDSVIIAHNYMNKIYVRIRRKSLFDDAPIWARGSTRSLASEITFVLCFVFFLLFFTTRRLKTGRFSIKESLTLACINFSLSWFKNKIYIYFFFAYVRNSVTSPSPPHFASLLLLQPTGFTLSFVLP